MTLNIESYQDNDVLIVKVTGQLNALTAPEFQKNLLALISAVNCRIVLDMGELNFLTSAGLRVFIVALKEARRLGGDVRLARMQPAIHDVVAAGAAKIIQIFGTVDGGVLSYKDAIASNTHHAGISGRHIEQNWSNEFLDRMRLIGDPEADTAVKELIATDQIAAVNKLMKTLITNDYVPPSELPPVIRDYLANTSTLPSWTDWSRINRGQHFFERYGVQIVTLLFCGSLPMSYAARKGVHVLWMTQRLNRNPYRRIIETAQMILDVMTPGGLQIGGAGLRSIQKVRLMHAAVRHLLLNSGQWDSEAYDHPINQEDLAGTLMAFSHVVNIGLPMLGVNLTKEEQEDYLHIWNVVGSLMGISTEMLPLNTDRAKVLSDTIFERHIAGTPSDNVEGQELMGNLMKMMQDMLPTQLLEELPKALVRYLIGDRVSDLLAVDGVSWQGAITSLQMTNHLVEYSTDNIIVGRAIGTVFRHVMKNLMRYNLNGDRASFRIPVTLVQEWGIRRETTGSTTESQPPAEQHPTE